MLTRTSLGYFCTLSFIPYIGLLFTIIVEIRANDVEFYVSTDVAYVGEHVYFICSLNGFDPATDEITIRFEGDVLLRFTNNTPIYDIGTDMHYTAEIVANKDLHLTINVANINDTGNYLCAISNKESGRAFTSSSVSLVIQYFPSPTCLAPAMVADVEYYSTSDDFGTLITKPGIKLRLVCIGTGDETNWLRSDGKDIEQANDNKLLSLSFTSSTDDHCVELECSSRSFMYADISYSCIVSVQTLNVAEHPCLAQVPSTEEPIITNATMPEQNESRVSSPLIIGASAASGLLFLFLLIIIICIIMVRYKRTHKHRSLTSNLVTPRPSQDIDNLPRPSIMSIDSFDSDIDMSPRQDRRARSSYENNNLSFYNQVEIGEPDQTDSKLNIDSRNSRISYENNDTGHFVLPPLKEDAKDSNFRLPPQFDPIYDKTPDDKDGVKSDDDNQDQTYGDEKNASPPASPPGSPGNSSLEPPVYADVKKNKNKTISSVMSDEDNTIPTYAFVNKGSDSNQVENKHRSLIPYAYTEEAAENKMKEENGLQYTGSVAYSEVEYY